MLRKVDLGLDQRLIDDELRRNIGKLRFAPPAHLLHHGFEVPLHVGDSNFDRMDEIEILRVLGEHRGEIAGERHVVADEHVIPNRHREPHGFCRVRYGYRSRSGILETSFQVRRCRRVSCRPSRQHTPRARERYGARPAFRRVPLLSRDGGSGDGLQFAAGVVTRDSSSRISSPIVDRSTAWGSDIQIPFL